MMALTTFDFKGKYYAHYVALLDPDYMMNTQKQQPQQHTHHGGVAHGCNHDLCLDFHSLKYCPRLPQV